MSNPSEWPDHVDALQSARNHHLMLFENDVVRVLGTRIAQGQTVPLHTHRWPSVLCILSWSDFVRRDGDGKTTFDSRLAPPLQRGSAVWSPPLPPHTVENVGDSELHTISVELKNSGMVESKIRR